MRSERPLAVFRLDAKTREARSKLPKASRPSLIPKPISAAQRARVGISSGAPVYGSQAQTMTSADVAAALSPGMRYQVPFPRWRMNC